MRLSRRVLAPLGAVVLLAVVVAGCGGGGIPGNAVVKIGDDPIRQTAFDHWMTIAATSQAQQQTAQGTAASAAVPDAPGFAKCIAAKKKAAPKPAKGTPNPTDAQYKTQCSQEYDQLKEAVMKFLIEGAWYQGEAHDLGITYTDAQAKKELDQQRIQSGLLKDSAYRDFLKSSGFDQEALLYQIRLQNLQTKLQERILKGKDKVGDAAITKYYNENKSSYATPEQRDLRLVLTKTEAQADAARKALVDGQSWKTVAAKHSIDEQTKANGGELAGVAKGTQEKALDEAVFAAKKGELSEPVKTQFGWYVFTVSKITAANQQTLEQAKESVRALLIQKQQNDAATAFLKDFREKWKGRTVCRGEYKMSDCKGEKDPSTNTTTATAEPQSAPAQSGAPAADGDAG